MSEMESRIYRFEELSSTNDWIREHLPELENGAVCIADRQTRGRGRHGRLWSTGLGENLAFSILIEWPDQNENFTGLALTAGLCLAKILRDEGLPAIIKWPNDVLVHEKKISGILVESILQNRKKFFILGIGLNVNAGTDFLARIDQNATSMSVVAKKNFDRDDILQKFLSSWSRTLPALLSSGFGFFLEEWKALSGTEGRQILVNPLEPEKPYTALALRLLPDGRLEIQLDSGEIRELTSGEIAW